MNKSAFFAGALLLVSCNPQKNGIQTAPSSEPNQQSLTGLVAEPVVNSTVEGRRAAVDAIIPFTLGSREKLEHGMYQTGFPQDPSLNGGFHIRELAVGFAGDGTRIVLIRHNEVLDILDRGSDGTVDLSEWRVSEGAKNGLERVNASFTNPYSSNPAVDGWYQAALIRAAKVLEKNTQQSTTPSSPTPAR